MFISVTVFVAVDFIFSVSLTTNPCYPQHLVSGFIFIVFFHFVFQWPLRSLSVLLLFFFRSLREFTFLVR